MRAKREREREMNKRGIKNEQERIETGNSKKTVGQLIRLSSGCQSTSQMHLQPDPRPFITNEDR